MTTGGRHFYICQYEQQIGTVLKNICLHFCFIQNICLLFIALQLLLSEGISSTLRASIVSISYCWSHLDQPAVQTRQLTFTVVVNVFFKCWSVHPHTTAQGVPTPVTWCVGHGNHRSIPIWGNWIALRNNVWKSLKWIVTKYKPQRIRFIRRLLNSSKLVQGVAAQPHHLHFMRTTVMLTLSNQADIWCEATYDQNLIPNKISAHLDD